MEDLVEPTLDEMFYSLIWSAGKRYKKYQSISIYVSPEYHDKRRALYRYSLDSYHVYPDIRLTGAEMRLQIVL